MVNQNTPSCHYFWIGIDVGKDTLAVYINDQDKALTIANKASAIAPLLREYSQATLVLESTGGYEAEVIKLAVEAGNTVYRVNARRVRAFMESVGIYAKTDAIDAKALAHFAGANVATLRPFVLPEPQMKALRQWARRRDELVALRTQETNRLKAPDNDCLKAGIKTVLACLQKQIATAEAHMQKLTEQSPSLATKIDVLIAVKGVGKVTALNLLVAMPELGTLDGKQAASLAGLAPHPRDSGKKKGYRRTGRGRVDVRRALYMATLSATRSNPVIKAFYTRLINNGKKPLQAIIASARKLLVILNAKLRDAALKPA